MDTGGDESNHVTEIAPPAELNQILFPTADSTLLWDGSEDDPASNRAHVIESDRQGFNASPRPPSLVSCSLVSRGGSSGYIWKIQEDSFSSFLPRCRSFADNNSLHGACLATSTGNQLVADSTDQPETVTSLTQGKQARAFSLPGSSYETLQGSLADHILETCSVAATRGSKSTIATIGSPANDLLGSKRDHKPSFDELPGYYVLEAREKPTAYYLHHLGDDRDKGRYDVEVVPVEVSSTQQGKPAYVIEFSCMHKRSLTARSIDLSESGIPDQLRDDHSNKVLVDKARGQIEHQRLGNNQFHVMDEEGKRVLESQSMYLINNDDLQLLVQAIEMEIICGRDLETLQENEDQDITGRMSHPKLQRGVIIPSTTSKADPATTISLPKTTYASISPNDLQVHTKDRDTEATTTATVITRKSIAEITWTQHEEVQNTPSHRASGMKSISPDSSKAPGSPGGEMVQGSVKIAIHHYKAVADLVSDVNRAQANLCLDSPKHITTFPQLRSRHCTSEWLSPPAELEQLPEPPRDDMYHQGVDAHCGVSRPSIVDVEEPQKPPHYNHGWLNQDPFHPEDTNVTDRRVSVASSTPTADKRIGALMGAASHRRRGSQPCVGVERQGRERQSLIPSLVDKLRNRGHRIFHRHKPSTSPDQRSTEAPTPSHSGLDQSSRVRSRDSTDPEGALGPNRNGNMLGVNNKRRDTCSEDNRPHMCMDDFAKSGEGMSSP